MKLFLIAGETSGDRHAAALVRALRQRNPALEVTALGGPELKAAGATLLEDITQYAVVGLIEVLRHLGTFRRLFHAACEALDRQRPDLVLLVDYPGFNLRLAREAKRRGLPVVYYVSPQLWAWGAGRIRTIRRTVALMLVFFRFEESLYQAAGVPVRWVGHPLLDAVTVARSPAEARRQHGLPERAPLVALLPGSRAEEVRRLLPILAGAAERLAARQPDMRVVVLQAPGLPRASYDAALAGRRAAVTLIPTWDYPLLAACDLALVASGTATLECALLERPMVIVYRTNPITWWIGRRLVTLPYLGLVNVVAGRRLVPECLQGDATPARVAEEADHLLESSAAREAMQQGCQEIRRALGASGAAARAAEAVLELLATVISHTPLAGGRS